MVLAFDGEAPPGCFEVAIPAPPSDDPFIRQELTETYYHLLWELVHVFFEHGGRQSAGGGAASFLYPFLDDKATDVDALLADVARSVVMKADEVGALREQTLTEGAETLHAAAAELRARLDAGGTLLALGNGGSATDAMDVVADFRAAGRRALDLTEDPAIITALANDIGTDAIFSRQVIAYGGPGDALIALSTSGNSGSVIAALVEARKRGLMTIACVGYGGGRVAAEELADHVVITRSEHIPRIQEAQASAYHVLCHLAA
jgi:D-sedoheptulose 7-phosphate isomerase